MGLNVRARYAELTFDEGSFLDALAGDQGERPRVKVSLGVAIRDYVALIRAVDAEVFDLDQFLAALELFGEQVLVEWNLEADGAPLPADGEGMTSLPIPVAMDLIRAWSSVIAARDPNSLAASANGASPEAAPEVMAAS